VRSVAEQSEKGAYKFLPIECPNCGFQGKVNISRLDQTFHCKECKQVFHVTKDGTVAGERPVEVADFDADAVPAARDDEPPWFERAFVNLPPAAKWAVGGVCALLLAAVLVWFFQPAEPLPDDLDGRAKLACKSFGLGDWSTLKRLAKSGTKGGLGQWFDRARPEEWNDVASDAVINLKHVRTIQKMTKYEGTHPLIDKHVVFSVQPAGKEQAVDITLIFAEDKQKKWWIDGDAMAKQAAPKKHAVKPTEEESSEEDETAEDSDTEAKGKPE
jgi:hypothetical protein